MNLTVSVDDEVVHKARQRAAQLGTSLNQLIHEYLQELVGRVDPKWDAAEFERLSKLSQGASKGWTFDRQEAHER
jgi:hypothetical protein